MKEAAHRLGSAREVIEARMARERTSEVICVTDLWLVLREATVVSLNLPSPTLFSESFLGSTQYGMRRTDRLRVLFGG